MTTTACITKKPQGLGFFEKWLTLWVLLAIAAGILLRKLAPGASRALDAMARCPDARMLSKERDRARRPRVALNARNTRPSTRKRS